MKITLIREERESGKEAVSTQETDMLMEKLKTENKTGYITELRSIIPHLKGTNARYEHIDRLPRLYPAVEMTRTKAGEHRIKTYNGLVLLEVNNLAGAAEAELVKQQAALLPQTFAAFCGSSGRSAKIWVRFTLPDGGLPKNEDDIALFHAHAYRLAVKCYQPLLPFPITLQAPSLLQSCRMTVDEQPYYSPTAVAFCLEQPCALPSEDNYRQRKQQESNPLLRMTPGYEVADTCNLLFEAALDRAFRDLDNWRRGDDLRPLLSRLAEHCFKAGIPEEEAVRQTLMHYYREADEPLVRLTLHNLYGELKGFGTRSSLNKDQETAFRLEEFMNRRYEFRYNTVLGDLEYRQRDSIHFYFKPADQRVRSSIAMNALKEGIRVWDRDITRFLSSDYVPLYNPIEEYLYNTGRWDGKDRIRALADLVPCHNPHWRELFYRWFLGMVAHWRGIDKQHGNNTCLLYPLEFPVVLLYDCIEVTGPIQTNVTINYRQLYAQAMHDIMKGERYWLDDTDEAIVKEYNREFERVDPLEELFLCHFRGAEESEEGEWLTAMQIFNDLQQKTRDKLAINRIAAFGRTLRKLDILNKKSNRGTLYHLVRIEE